MATEFVLWGVLPDDPDWAESVITTATSRDDPKLAKAREWAVAKGMRLIRLASSDMDVRPDFTKTLAKGSR